MKAYVAGTLRVPLHIALVAFCLGPTAAQSADVDPAVLQAESERIAAVNKASPSVLAIFAQGGQGGGSGVVISADGYALSNFHVVKPAGNAMKCGMSDGKLYDAVIVGVDPVGDVALIKLFGREDFPAAELGDSDEVQVGDWCFAMGNPFLLATDFHPSVSYGVVSGTHRYQYPSGTLLEYADCIQVDASINPGNSGGPLFDARGRLIGINGRGSFEKRGRVNVGVGYAISMNQIKNFLGYLKSGRIVDHATLGARVGVDDRGHVVVSDVLDTSDAYRRGVRYDDEVLSFAGKSIKTPNVLKNVLGTYPKGWRVPLSYKHEDKKVDVLVRLAGVHRTEELLEKAEGRGPAPMPGPPPGGMRRGMVPRGGPPDPEQPPGPIPGRGRIPGLGGAAAPMPKIVRDHFETRPGYANYYFNKLNQERVWKALVARGDFSTLRGDWTLSGQIGAGEMRFLLTDTLASLSTPGGEAKIDIGDSLEDLNPPGSQGLLIAMHLWRRLLVVGPEKFGSVYYLGTAPLAGKDGLVDVLIGTSNGVDAWFYCDPADGSLLALEMYSAEHVDPCEVYFQEYHEVQGRQLPGRIEVRVGNVPYGQFQITKFELEKADAP